MPTGYTAGVVDGKITDFPAFAMQCARAFGALITMRDDAFDAPIPDEIKPSNYYAERMVELQKKIERLEAMTPAGAEESAGIAYAEAVESRRKSMDRDRTEAARLNAMLEKVRQWEPPSPDHEEMKKFMVEQLTISMPHDYPYPIPVKMAGTVWLTKELNEARGDLVRATTENEKEIERATGRTKWIRDLRASLTADPIAA